MSYLKRIAMPDSWQIKKKENKFVARPLPGQSFKLGMPINTILRDILGLASNNNEVKKILNNKEIFVNGKRRKECRFMVGLMDVISIPEINKFYRVLLTKKGKIILKEIKKEESNLKLCKILNKKKKKKDMIQLNLSDGRNILIKEDKYKTNDSLLISLPKQEVKEYIELKKSNIIYLIGGKYIGEIGVIEDVKDNIVSFKLKNKKVETRKKKIFVVGKDKPLITI